MSRERIVVAKAERGNGRTGEGKEDGEKGKRKKKGGGGKSLARSNTRSRETHQVVGELQSAMHGVSWRYSVQSIKFICNTIATAGLRARYERPTTRTT